MSRSQPERRYEASPRLHAADPTARALAHATDRVTAQERSMPRCRRKQPPAPALGFVVNAIVFYRRALWLAVPDRNWPCGRRRKHNLAYGVADQFGHTAP